MRLAVVSLLYILTEITVCTIGLDCRHYTSFELKRSEDVIDIEQTFATITTKSFKDHERCSRLQIKDTTNETYTALDCLDKSICENPESWCHRFTGSLFTSCQNNLLRWRFMCGDEQDEISCDKEPKYRKSNMFDIHAFSCEHRIEKSYRSIQST